MPEVTIALKLGGYLVKVGDINDKFFSFTDWPSAVKRKEEIENDYPRWATNHCSEQKRWGEPPSVDCKDV